MRNTGIKIGSNRDINKDRKKLPVAKPDMLPKKIVIPGVQLDPHHNLKLFAKKYNDEKLVITILIVGADLLAYHFW